VTLFEHDFLSKFFVIYVTRLYSNWTLLNLINEMLSIVKKWIIIIIYI